jgi:GntR family transcriptional regulator of gluconate operon
VRLLRPIDLGRSLAENAADRIREQVLSGGYAQGQHLVEARIADELQISRGPVREAFKMLRAEGLVTEEPRRGTFVVSITAQDVRDIYGLRAAIEGAAARLLCRAGDAATIDRLEAAADAIGAAAGTGDERIMPSIEHVADQHRPVVAAIRAGDEEEAVRLVTEHSERAGQLLADLLEHKE